MASTTFGAVDGPWDTAALWSNGVPSATVSAIVSSTSGIPVLPANTSATTKNLSGAGTIGMAGGNVNKLTIKTPTSAPVADTVCRFAVVEAMENATQTSLKPKGHA